MEPTTRRSMKRQSPEVQAARAATLLDDPNLRAKFDEVRADFIRDIEFAVLDGTDARTNLVLERVRQLQALAAVKAAIVRPLVTQKLRERKVESKRA